MAKGLDSSYQLLWHWWSYVSSEQATVDSGQLSRGDGRVLPKMRGSGTVLPSVSEKASRSERRLISTYIAVDQG